VTAERLGTFEVSYLLRTSTLWPVSFTTRVRFITPLDKRNHQVLMTGTSTNADTHFVLFAHATFTVFLLMSQ
jgi:hypothetical protein